MKLFGLEVRRAKSGASPVPTNRGGWWPIIKEPFSGAFQRGEEWTVETVLAHHAVYACITLIANDIGKLPAKLMQLGANGIWTETRSPAFSPVLRRPNRFQNHIQFKEWWVMSKLLRGNTYALKQRDRRNVVEALYLLDPSRVTVLVAPDGEVYYKLMQDNISGLEEQSVTVPASEIIHDRMNCLFHPLVGVSPLYASGLAANMGIKIQENSANFFANGSNPGGVLSAPGTITKPTADRLKEHWDNEYKGANSGKVAVLGDGLTFSPMRMTAEDSQMIEQLKFTAEMVCSAFHVPPFKLGIGTMPTYNNAELLNQIYYSDCLQSHIEQFELVVSEGLGMGVDTKSASYAVELDLDALLRMDSSTQMATLKEGVGAGIMSPNEARFRVNLPPTKGGDDPYLQQQNYSLGALSERDKLGPPPGTTPAPKPTPPAEPPADGEEPPTDAELAGLLVKSWGRTAA